MRKAKNYYEGILTKLYKKEQDEKLKIRVKNARSILNNKKSNLALYKVYTKKVNKSNQCEDTSKKTY